METGFKVGDHIMVNEKSSWGKLGDTGIILELSKFGRLIVKWEDGN